MKVINGAQYSWEQIYAISGLCYEDWLNDSEGSYSHFIKCLKNLMEDFK